MTIVTPPTKAMGKVCFGLRTSPAILLASHQPPKLKNALMTAAGDRRKDWVRAGAAFGKGSRLLNMCMTDTTAQPTSANRIASLRALTNDMITALKRVP